MFNIDTLQQKLPTDRLPFLGHRELYIRDVANFFMTSNFLLFLICGYGSRFCLRHEKLVYLLFGSLYRWAEKH